MPKKDKVVDPDKMSRRQQFVATYKMAKKTDPRLGLILLGRSCSPAVWVRPLLVPAARRAGSSTGRWRSSAG